MKIEWFNVSIKSITNVLSRKRKMQNTKIK